MHSVLHFSSKLKDHLSNETLPHKDFDCLGYLIGYVCISIEIFLFFLTLVLKTHLSQSIVDYVILINNCSLEDIIRRFAEIQLFLPVNYKVMGIYSSRGLSSDHMQLCMNQLRLGDLWFVQKSANQYLVHRYRIVNERIQSKKLKWKAITQVEERIGFETSWNIDRYIKYDNTSDLKSSIFSAIEDECRKIDESLAIDEKDNIIERGSITPMDGDIQKEGMIKQIILLEGASNKKVFNRGAKSVLHLKGCIYAYTSIQSTEKDAYEIALDLLKKDLKQSLSERILRATLSLRDMEQLSSPIIFTKRVLYIDPLNRVIGVDYGETDNHLLSIDDSIDFFGVDKDTLRPIDKEKAPISVSNETPFVKLTNQQQNLVNNIMTKTDTSIDNNVKTDAIPLKHLVLIVSSLFVLVCAFYLMK